jgi:hypothetical protein
MKKILFLFLLLVGFSFVGVGDVFAQECSFNGKTGQCIEQSDGCPAPAEWVDGEPACNSATAQCCVFLGETCTFEGRTGACINIDTQTCPSPGSVEFTGGECGADNMGCCVPPEDEECTGGSCMTQERCDEKNGTVKSSCPGAADCDATEVFCVISGGGGNPGPGGTAASIDFANPLKYDTVQEVVGALLAALQGIIVLLSIVFIVIGAVLYITSGGNQGMVTLAKGAILASMIGLAIGIAAPSFLKEIYDILIGVDDPPICDPANPPGPGDPICVPDEVESATPILDILMNTLNFLLAIIGVLFLIMLTVGGIMYLFSGGDQTRIDTGKKMVTFSLIGISIALAALLLVRQIALFFG